MNIQENIPLKPFTTFSIGGTARRLAAAATDKDIRDALQLAAAAGWPVFVLGGGSNILVSDSGFHGLVIKLETKGIQVLAESAEDVRIRAAAGERWDDFVARCVQAGYWGVENLSAIPGTVGALPIQNVGAYGQEASEVVESVEVLDRRTLADFSLPARDCGFAYRSSIFNTSAKGRWIVTSVIFRLRKQGRPVIQYRSIQDWLAVHDRHLARKALRRLRRWPLFRALPADAAGGFSAADMRRCITAIRSDGRLPDVRTLGNVGSFFKNTILSAEQYETALARANVCLGPAAVNAIRATAVGLDNGRSIKVETGRLIIQSGAQKFRRGGAALYSRNPIVVVNASGAATAADVLGLAEDVRRRVHECTGIQIPIEPERVGFES